MIIIYGNDFTLWSILETVLNKLEISLDEKENKEKTEPERKKERALEILKKGNIAISDTIKAAKRSKTNGCYADIFDEDLTKLNTDIIKQICESNISKIFFTSFKAYKFFHYILQGKSKLSDKENNVKKLVNKKQKTPEFIILPSPSKSMRLLSEEEKIDFYTNAFKDVFTKS